MTETALFQLVDRALGGGLRALLTTWKRAGVSKRAAANLLAVELHGIEISPDTIRRWMMTMSDDEGANGGSAAA